MNKIYALVWNPAQECWNVVSEHCSRRGKGSAKRRLAVALSLLGLTALEPAHALPTGQNIVAGQGSITTNGQSMTVNQQSDKLITQWDAFNVGRDESLTFKQPGRGSVALNRVMGVNGSDIQGKIDANGKVFIVNPNGVIFGKTAQVNVGGLVASTRDISNADFLAGKNRFVGTSQAEVRNEGVLNAAQAGSIALLGAQVNNQGVILAQMGSIALGAGDDITLNFDGDNLLNLKIDGAAAKALVQNGGLLKADGGQVLMTARTAGDMLQTVVNNRGAIEATTLNNQAGRIVLDGGERGVVNVAGRLDASANAGDGGVIETRGARVAVQTATQITTRATAGKTGNWKLTATDVNVGDGATLKADTLSTALTNSNVELVSTQGDVAISAPVAWQSANKLSLTAERAGININAPLKATGAGAGLALNHKTGYTLNNAASVQLSGNGASFSLNGESYKVVQNLAQLLDINKDLNARYVLGNNINDRSRINAIGGNGAFSGTFEGLGNTLQGLTIGGNGPYVGLFGASTGKISNLNLDSITVITNGRSQFSGSLAGYNAGTIQNVKATNVNVSGSGDLGGLVGANMGTLSNVLVSGRVNGSNSRFVGGLVGVNFGNAGRIDNSQANVNVFSNVLDTDGNGGVGGLVGRNAAVIANSTSQGTVGASGNAVNIGGLAGLNTGRITHALSNAAVAGNRGSLTGGLVGLNQGDISNSAAVGYVTGNGSKAIGGLVGRNEGALRDVQANGDVLDTGSRNVGGLIGINETASELKNVQAKNAVTGGDNANVGGLVGLNKAGKIANASAGGKVSGGDNSLVGGLIGDNYGSLSNVSADTEVRAGKASRAGGLIGRNGAVVVSNADVRGSVVGAFSQALGGLIGENNGGTLDRVSADTRVAAGDDAMAGGLVGNHRGGRISNAKTAGSVSAAANSRVGGLVGNNEYGNISNSQSSARVKGGYNSDVGGLVGYNQGALSQVQASGDVEGGDVSRVGGLVGIHAYGASGDILQASASGNVTGKAGSNVGGIAGKNDGLIRHASASGKISSAEASMRGGLVGFNTGKIYDSSFSGSVMPKQFDGQWVGSLVGINVMGYLRNNSVSGVSASLPKAGLNFDGAIE
ncbi:Heme/hemopexin-binding protein precursor [Serratia ficaria]|uniref:GLUG motif-containing protein n=1 Tax=Serratia ficaria TaxID=61651 RepID=UPI001199713F|nr:GLUG motif-containing protein [Serratia ficaria]VVA48566.1 Heme/hemopexin-binding protein precursor [Serratia ficaria]